MNRAHVEMDDGRVFDVMIREFRVDHSFGCEPKAMITGFLTRLTKREPQATELGVPTEHYNCKCALTQTHLTVERVIYNAPATVVYWSDKTRTVVKCQPGDAYDPKTGFLLALCKKVCGNTGNYNDLLRKYVPGYSGEKIQTEPSIKRMREELDDFCHHQHCLGCPLDKGGFECGRGKHFIIPKGEHGYMTDESIVKHYKAMKGAKS